MRLFQVGAGSGGIVVLDLLTRDPRLSHVTLVEPDIYSATNVHRHIFPPSAVGMRKAELAAAWVKERRPELPVDILTADITDPAMQDVFDERAATCDVGVCAVDNEAAKFAFDAILRKAGKPWTLGEVLSGGIGGWVHVFLPDGPCYGCVASHLQRHVVEAPAGPPPDYANPGGPVPEATIPASKASIEVIAGLHALATLDPTVADFSSLLFTMKRVPGVFDDAFRPFRMRIPKSSACLFCSTVPGPATAEELDVALDQALARFGHE
jgi:molybdopterin/thiamine biosynthesis adenylyltransferase